MNHVITSMEFVQVAVWTVSSEQIVIILVKTDILAETVHGNVHLTVKVTHVGTQTDGVHVPQV